MAKKVNVDYRKICQEHYGFTDDEMKGMDVHHIMAIEKIIIHTIYYYCHQKNTQKYINTNL